VTPEIEMRALVTLDEMAEHNEREIVERGNYHIRRVVQSECKSDRAAAGICNRSVICLENIMKI